MLLGWSCRIRRWRHYWFSSRRVAWSHHWWGNRGRCRLCGRFSQPRPGQQGRFTGRGRSHRFTANLLQQKLTNTVYKAAGLPGQVKPISYKQAVGSALGTSGGQALVKLAPKAGAAVGNAVTSLLSPTAKVAPSIARTATTTTAGKVTSALYEGGTSAYGELAADSLSTSPARIAAPSTSRPSAGNQSMSVFAAPSLSTGCLLCGGSPNYSSGGTTSLPSKFSF